MRLSTLCTRVIAGLAGLATATALAAPLAASACAVAPSPHRLGYARPRPLLGADRRRPSPSARLLQRGTGLLEDGPASSLAPRVDQPLALPLADEHSKVFWQDAQTGPPDGVSRAGGDRGDRRRVSVVVIGADVRHQHRLLVAITDRTR